MKSSATGLAAQLKQLHLAIRACRKCNTKPGIQVVNVQPAWNAVLGRRRHHKWGMIIGQAPTPKHVKMAQAQRRGREESSSNDESDWMFPGSTGKRLRNWLKSAGFTEADFRTRFHGTVAMKCYPGQRGEHDRKPSTGELTACREFLEHEIRLLDPQVLIPAGEVALRCFFPKMTLSEAVGRSLPWKGRKLVCLPHPSGRSRWLNTPENAKKLKDAQSRLRGLGNSMVTREG